MIGKRLKTLFLVNESPHRTALTFAVGVCIGISPLLGLHTLLGLAIAAIFSMNRVVMLTGVYVTNPWTIVPIYAFCTWIGTYIMDVNISVASINWHGLRFNTVVEQLGELLMPFLVGTSFMSLVLGLLSYVVVRKVLEKSLSIEPGPPAEPEP
jgi:uncharacterized protein (DUF2062 family)